MTRRRRVIIVEWPKNLQPNPLDWPARETRWIDVDAPSPSPELQYLGILAFPDRKDRAKHFLRCYTTLAFKNAIQAGRMDPKRIRVAWWNEGSNDRPPYKDTRRERLLSGIDQAFGWIEKRLIALEAFDRRFQLEAFGRGGWRFKNPGLSLNIGPPGSVTFTFDPAPATLKGGFREQFQHLSKLDKWDSKADKAETAAEHAMARIWSASNLWDAALIIKDDRRKLFITCNNS